MQFVCFLPILRSRRKSPKKETQLVINMVRKIPRDLRVAGQAAPRRDHVTFRDQEGVKGWTGVGGGNDNTRSGRGGRGGVVGDGDVFEESPGSGDAPSRLVSVHLPNLE